MNKQQLTEQRTINILVNGIGRILTRFQNDVTWTPPAHKHTFGVYGVTHENQLRGLGLEKLKELGSNLTTDMMDWINVNEKEWNDRWVTPFEVYNDLDEICNYNRTRLSDEFDVRDALGGTVTGDWQKDKKRLNKQGLFCREKVYNEAYQKSAQK